MRITVAWMLLPLLLPAQETRAAPDPATFLPEGAPFYLELVAPSAAARDLRGADLFARILDAPARAALDATLADVAALEVRHAVFAFMPALVFEDRWILVADAPDAARIASFLEARAPAKDRRRPATGTIPPFVALADSDATIAAAAALAAGKGSSIAARPDFLRFRRRLPRGAALLHVDAAKLAPRWLRFGIDGRLDAFGVFLAHHVVHTLKTARTLSVALHLADGAGLDAIAEIDPIAAEVAFTETRPAAPFLQPTGPVAASASLPRALLGFWDAREKIVPEKARAPLSSFQNNASILLGGVSVEELFAALGSSVDLYVGRGGDGARPGYRYPAAAVVGAVSDPATKTNLLLTFQTAIGLANAERAMDGLPRFFQESAVHRDVLVASARLLPETLADHDDERLQIEPAFAIAADRLIIGTNRAIVRSLVDAALDGRARPREPGDVASLSGPEAATLVRDASAFLRGRQALEKGKNPEEARRAIDVFAGLLERIDGASVRFDVDESLATLSIRAVAPAILAPRPESR